MSGVRTIVLTALATISILGIVAIGFVFSGIYNIGADARHTKPVSAMIEVLRERSIADRSAEIAVHLG